MHIRSFHLHTRYRLRASAPISPMVRLIAVLVSIAGMAIVSPAADAGGAEIFADISAGLPAVSASAVAWGDYDNDGRLDILLTGYSSSLGNIARVYHNDGNG